MIRELVNELLFGEEMKMKKDTIEKYIKNICIEHKQRKQL